MMASLMVRRPRTNEGQQVQLIVKSSTMGGGKHNLKFVCLFVCFISHSIRTLSVFFVLVGW
jgi:hypothetical protein